MSTSWTPSVTVAAVIERNGHFLLVEEMTSNGARFTQPAGHLDEGESLLDAVSREVMEEAAFEFKPTNLLGVYMDKYFSPRLQNEVTYMRFAFTGELGAQHDRPLDEGILRTVWMTRDELLECRDRHRGPLVLRCVDDYLAGIRGPLDLIHVAPCARTAGSP